MKKPAKPLTPDEKMAEEEDNEALIRRRWKISALRRTRSSVKIMLKKAKSKYQVLTNEVADLYMGVEHVEDLVSLRKPAKPLTPDEKMAMMHQKPKGW